jgi:hypothetical protein
MRPTADGKEEPWLLRWDWLRCAPPVSGSLREPPARTAKVDCGLRPPPLRGRPPVGLCRCAALSSHRRVSCRLRRETEGVGLVASSDLCFALELRSSSHRRASSRLRRGTEGVGFEPTETCASSVFKTDAIDHSATPPERRENYPQGRGIVHLARRASPESRGRRKNKNRRPSGRRW